MVVIKTPIKSGYKTPVKLIITPNKLSSKTPEKSALSSTLALVNSPLKTPSPGRKRWLSRYRDSERKRIRMNQDTENESTVDDSENQVLKLYGTR